MTCAHDDLRLPDWEFEFTSLIKCGHVGVEIRVFHKPSHFLHVNGGEDIPPPAISTKGQRRKVSIDPRDIIGGKSGWTMGIGRWEDIVNETRQLGNGLEGRTKILGYFYCHLSILVKPLYKSCHSPTLLPSPHNALYLLPVPSPHNALYLLPVHTHSQSHSPRRSLEPLNRPRHSNAVTSGMFRSLIDSPTSVHAFGQLGS